MWLPTWPSAATCGALRSMAHGARGLGLNAYSCRPGQALLHAVHQNKFTISFFGTHCQTGGLRCKMTCELGQEAEVHVRPSKSSLPILSAHGAEN